MIRVMLGPGTQISAPHSANARSCSRLSFYTEVFGQEAYPPEVRQTLASSLCI